ERSSLFRTLSFDDIKGTAHAAPPQHSCDLSTIRRMLIESAGIPDLAPHPISPLASTAAYYDRNRGVWWARPRAKRVGRSYIDETRSQNELPRVCILEYSDQRNWSSLKSQTSPLDVLQPNGAAVSVDDHFLMEPTAPPLLTIASRPAV